MPTLVTGMQSKGFTLVEILVVILIVSITLGFALIAFGDFGEKRRIIVAAEQFSQYVVLTQQQAILDSSTLGIVIHHNGYELLRLTGPKQWSPMPSNRIFRPQRFPKGMLINLAHDSQKPNKPSKPRIIIQSSGEMTAFKLNFGSEKRPAMITVVGHRNGMITRVSTP